MSINKKLNEKKNTKKKNKNFGCTYIKSQNNGRYSN